jgi:hypothetical protein
VRCYVCRIDVSDADHEQHCRVLDVMYGSGVEGAEDMFVHCTGPQDEFDADGVVVVCDRHLITELADSLKVTA